MKKVKIHLIKNEDNKFKVIHYDDGLTIKIDKFSSYELKEYMKNNINKKQLDFYRKATQLFKAKTITLKGV